MSRPKGLEKTGGRKPGTPNKKTQEVSDLLKSLNFDPFTELVKIAQEPNVERHLKVKICIELAQYICPKLKAVAIDEGEASQQGEQKLSHHVFMRELYERNREFA